MMQRGTVRQSPEHFRATPLVAPPQAFPVADRGKRGTGRPLPSPSRPGVPRPRGPRTLQPLPFLIAGGVIAALFLVVTLGAAGIRFVERGRLYENVYVNDQNLGGLTQVEARAKLAESFAPVADAPITLTYNERQWTPKRAELGIRPDIDGTVAEAYAVGRSGNPLGQLWRVMQMKSGAKSHVPLSVVLDQITLNQYLDRLQADIGTPPTDAIVSVKNGVVAVTPGADGVRLDREQVQQQVQDDLAHLQRTALTLSVTFASPDVNTDAAIAAKAHLEDWASAPLVLTFGEKKWEIVREQVLAGVRIGPGPQFALSLDPAAFTPTVNAIATELKRDPVNAVIGWDNALVVRKPAQAGQRLNVDETLKRLAVWQGEDRAIALPVEVAQPRIPDDVSKLGITTRVAQGRSNFAGSDAARVKNIAVAAGYLDDTVVGPGETFSFLDSIGEISKARGYQEGYVILAEETVPGIGGGVCQVATTMFRAAMYSGLPIVDRNPHAYIVSYYQLGGYPLGLDAAVFSPDVDLKFQNTTNSYLLIKTAIDGAANLSISIYGPDLGYNVDISDPVITNKKNAPDDEYQVDPSLPPGTKKQVEFAKFGEDVVITRTVKDKSGNLVRDPQKVFTNYQAWPNKFLVSPDRAPGRVSQATTAPIRPAAQTSNTTVIPTKAAISAPAPTTAPVKAPAPTTPPVKVPAPTAVAMPAKPVVPTMAPVPVTKATTKT